jgi:hypothetical protein
LNNDEFFSNYNDYINSEEGESRKSHIDATYAHLQTTAESFALSNFNESMTQEEYNKQYDSMMTELFKSANLDWSKESDRNSSVGK